MLFIWWIFSIIIFITDSRFQCSIPRCTGRAAPTGVCVFTGQLLCTSPKKLSLMFIFHCVYKYISFSVYLTVTGAGIKTDSLPGLCMSEEGFFNHVLSSLYIQLPSQVLGPRKLQIHSKFLNNIFVEFFNAFLIIFCYLLPYIFLLLLFLCVYTAWMNCLFTTLPFY